MFGNDPIAQLRKLQGHEVSPEALDHGRMKLLAFMAVHPLIRSVRPNWWRRAMFWKPFAAITAMTFATLGSAMAVSASEGAVPGDSLYRVKLLAENVRTRLAISAESRFRLHAAQAEHRLDEAEALMQLPAKTDNERQTDLHVAMDQYRLQISAMNGLADRLSSDDSNKSVLTATMAAEEFGRVLGHHDDLVASASTSSNDDTLLTGADSALILEAKVSSVLKRGDARKQSLHQSADTLRAYLAPHQAAAAPDSAAPADEGHHGGSHGNGTLSHDTHEHDHVETDATSVPLPIVNQGRIRTKSGIGSGLNVPVEIDNESTR